MQTICGFQNCRLWRIASLACANTLIEESAFHRIARQRQSRAEMLARDFVPPTAQLKLAKGRRVKWIASQAIAILDRADRFEPMLRTIALRDRNGAVECHDRGRAYRHQRIVR
jgi:hypothetical protein